MLRNPFIIQSLLYTTLVLFSNSPFPAPFHTALPGTPLTSRSLALANLVFPLPAPSSPLKPTNPHLTNPPKSPLLQLQLRYSYFCTLIPSSLHNQYNQLFIHIITYFPSLFPFKSTRVLGFKRPVFWLRFVQFCR